MALHEPEVDGNLKPNRHLKQNTNHLYTNHFKTNYMQKEQKQLFAKIVGEIYKLQTACNMDCDASPATIYGLLNGMEQTINDELEMLGWISENESRLIMAIFAEIYDNNARRRAFKGYDQISAKVKAAGIEKYKVIMIVRQLQMEEIYPEITDRILYEISPAGIEQFELKEERKGERKSKPQNAAVLPDCPPSRNSPR